MNLKLDTVLRDFNGQALKSDLTIEDLVGVLNKVLAAATEESQELAVRLNALAEKNISVKKDFTIRNVIHALACSNLPELNVSEIETLFEVAVATIAKDEVELKAQQIVVLQKGIKMVFKSPLVQRQAVLLLEGKDFFTAV